MRAGMPVLSFLVATGVTWRRKAQGGRRLRAGTGLTLYVPTVVFGISAFSSALLWPAGFRASCLIRSAISLVWGDLAPFAAAAALRVHMQ